MAIHNHNYGWSDSIDSTDTKGSLLDANTSIDPSFSQAQHASADDSAFAGDHVAQAVAKAQAASRVKDRAAQMMAGQAAQHTGSPVHQSQAVSSQPMEMHRPGRPLTNTKRAQQNRQAQRAFRQRKELYIKDLEAKVNELKESKEAIEVLRRENVQLRDYILALQSRLIEHPGGVPPPPVVRQGQGAPDMYDHHKNEK